MTDFEQRREEYFKKIKSKPEILEKIIVDNYNSEKGQKTLEIIMTPRNERELDAAEILYSMTSDLIMLLESYYNDELEEITLEENKGIKAYIDIIKGLKEGKEEASLIPKEATAKEIAEILYSFVVALLFYSDDAVDYIAEKAGFDLSDDFVAQQFVVYYEKSKRIMDSGNSSEKDFEECTEEEIKAAKETAIEFHKRCEEGKKDLSKETEVERLVRNVTNQFVKVMEEKNKRNS